ncbi:hypothetical protein NP493_685g00000 [Ridgeia piscesae]|uniref:Uncharacterized protein n=1 Tax=Ridgeia piscesae TaxID=27915 RepID=A0AAD9KRN4_RIDPI|nr:hypothetical protein NP493_685g00000 [Ridgeia piscesae]
MQRQSKAQPRVQLTALPQENLPSQWGEDIAHPSILPSQKDGCESEAIQQYAEKLVVLAGFFYPPNTKNCV